MSTQEMTFKLEGLMGRFLRLEMDIGGMLGAKLGPKPAPPQERTLVTTTSSEKK